ncbi:hypothetical protein H0N95_01200, partial [Candidatus Micrarchaeota archaeon]|nr:hypothetical protein [Candidatus Micrarchaeota archaeon]
MVRLLFSPLSREQLFRFLKRKLNVRSMNQLAERLGAGKSTVRKWRYGELYVPGEFVPAEIFSKLEVVDSKEDNWGAVKGGNQGGLNKAREVHKKKMLDGCRKGGVNSAKKLRVWRKKHSHETESGKLGSMISSGKIRKTKELVALKEKKNETWFVSNRVPFDSQGVTFSVYDKEKGLKLPSSLTPLLAEEIGMHVGDGSLSNKKYYYSLRGDIKEKDYYATFVLPAYKKLFNLDLNLLERPPICGIEMSSRALYEFKRDVIGLPVGEKVGRVDVPSCIIESRDEVIISSFLRGVFDTDGCVYFLKSRRYPRIQLEIRSNSLISSIKKLLDKMGFIPAVYEYKIVLNGPVMFNKWVNQIGSSNPKHQ